MSNITLTKRPLVLILPALFSLLLLYLLLSRTASNPVIPEDKPPTTLPLIWARSIEAGERIHLEDLLQLDGQALSSENDSSFSEESGASPIRLARRYALNRFTKLRGEVGTEVTLDQLAIDLPNPNSPAQVLWVQLDEDEPSLFSNLRSQQFLQLLHHPKRSETQDNPTSTLRWSAELLGFDRQRHELCLALPKEEAALIEELILQKAIHFLVSPLPSPTRTITP